LCAPTDVFAQALFRALQRPELLADARFATRDGRVRNSAELDALIGAWTAELSTSAALLQLEAAGVPAAEVRHPRAAVRDRRVLRREECVQLDHPVHGAVADLIGSGLPIKFSDASAAFDRPPPAPAEHNRAIYGDGLGYSPERLAELHELGVI
jgi:CoA:oxalate CoA-transferase